MILNSLKDKGGCDGHKISYHSLHLKKNEILFQVFILKSCILDIHREEKVKKKKNEGRSYEWKYKSICSKVWCCKMILLEDWTELQNTQA